MLTNMSRVVLSLMILWVVPGVAAGSANAELVVSRLDTVTSVYTRPGVIQEVVALGGDAVPLVIPRLGSEHKATRDAAARVLSEICGPEHVVLLLEEHWRLREAGLRSPAIRVIEDVVRSQDASHPASLSSGDVDSDFTEIVARILSGEGDWLYSEFGADASVIVIGAGLPVDGGLTRLGTPAEVIPLAWPEAKESFSARDYEGREYVRFSVRLLDLPPTDGSFPALAATLECLPSAVGFVSGWAGRLGTDVHFGFSDFWVKCGGRWHFASAYLETVPARSRRSPSN